MGPVKRCFLIIGVGAVTIGLCGAAMVPAANAFFSGVHPKDKVTDVFAPLSQPTEVLASNGTVLGRLGLQDRTPVSLKNVSPLVIQAVLATEDQTFYNNAGIDPKANVRALFRNVDSGDIAQGGSTITQQLVKNRLLTPKRDVSRKVKEIIASLRLTKEASKNKILEQYLNTVYFGQGSYGVESASTRFFGKKAKKLTLPEAALLASVISSPEANNPFEHPDRALTRRAAVLDQMVKLHFVSSAQANAAKGDPLPTVLPVSELRPQSYFVEEVQRQLLDDDRLGGTQQERYNAVFRGGLKVYSTLNPDAQVKAQNAVDTVLPKQPPFTAALVSMDPSNGHVIAMATGSDFQELQYNLVTQGERQPGSTYKVITLAAALEAGYSPKDSVDGTSPCTIKAAGFAPWKTANAEPSGGSVMTLRNATVNSVNCAYAHVIASLGPNKVIDMAHRMGIHGTIPEVLSITLGTAEASPLEMATVFATLAADGVRHDPVFVSKVVGPDGKTLFTNKSKGERVITPENARTENNILQGVVTSGTGTAARISGRQVAGKTGTTEEYSDAWFCGFTPQLATAVWMGSPKGRQPMRNVGGIRVFGGTYPARMFSRYMSAELANKPVEKFPEPNQKLWPKGKFISDKGRGASGERPLTTDGSGGFGGGSDTTSPSTTSPVSTTAPPITVPNTISVPTSSP